MHLHTLGGLSTAPVQLLPFKQRLLLAYLAVNGSTERAALRAWLWPDVAHPATNLRMALAGIETTFPGATQKNGQCLTLAMPSDLADLQAALGARQQHQIVSIYSGAFLSGVVFPPELEGPARWAEQTRSSLAQQVREALMNLSGQYMRSGRREEAAGLIAQALQVNGAPALRANEIERLAQLLDQQQVAARIDVRPQVTTPLVARPVPRPQAMFIGREALVKELLEKLRNGGEPLMTLLGAAGIGKSRLAIEVARRLETTSGDAWTVAYVPLEALPNADGLMNAIAGRFDLPPQEGLPAFERLKERIGRHPTVVVLDGFEHLIEAARDVSALVAACPHLRVLVTSRVRLHAPGEMVMPIDGLVVKVANGRSEATQLFVARTRRVRPTFLPTQQDVNVIERVTSALDGSPLGIELAATWMQALTLSEIESTLCEIGPLQLDERVRRNETMVQAVVARSWALLPVEEQRVLRASAALPGGFTGGAAREVLGADERLLAGLVDRSMLKVDASGRFGQHALLLAYSVQEAGRHPEERQEVEVLCADYFLQMIEPMFLRLRQREGAALMSQLDLERPNLLHVLEWAHLHHPEVVLRLGTSLFFYWYLRYPNRRVVSLMMTVLETDVAEGTELRAQALWAVGTLLLHMGHGDEAQKWLEGCRQLSRALGLVQWEADAVLNLGDGPLLRGEYEQARALYLESLHLYQSVGYEGSVTALLSLGRTDQKLGRLKDAASWYEEGLRAAEAFDNQQDRVRLLRLQGELSLLQGDDVRARDQLELGVRSAREFGMLTELPRFLDGFAALLAADGLLAARVWGAWAARVKASGVDHEMLEEHTFEALRAQVRQDIGEVSFLEAWALGEQLTLEEALSLWSVTGVKSG